MATAGKPGSGLKSYAPQRTIAQPNRNAINANREAAQANIAQAGQQAPGAAPLPWDSIAEAKVAEAGATEKNSVDQIAANRALGMQEFGIDEGYDDYKTNPFSQAAILQHRHESNEAGITTTAGLAGYSGQTANAHGIEAGQTNQAHQGIVSEDERAKAGWLAEEQAAQQADREAVQEAQEGAVNRAAEANNPEVPVGNTTNNYVTKKVVVKKKGGKK